MKGSGLHIGVEVEVGKGRGGEGGGGGEGLFICERLEGTCRSWVEKSVCEVGTSYVNHSERITVH